MKQTIFTILENRQIARDIMLMRLQGDTADFTRPGQFVNLKLEGLYLRRPISVCDLEGDVLTLIYKVVGKGTAQMAEMQAGETLDVLTALGNGYDTADSGDKPLLVGGGVGVPPLYGLAKWLIRAGKSPSAILGFNRAEEIFFDMEFAALGLEVTVTTADGSAGVKGFVTDAMKGGEYVCACGPEPMLRAVYQKASGGQFSFEARMGCGFGACMGCTMPTVDGYKRVCKDGPVLGYQEIKW